MKLKVAFGIILALAITSCTTPTTSSQTPSSQVVVDEVSPVLFGTESDAIVVVGSSWNPLSGVYAYDNVDGAITNIEVIGEYNLDEVGNYPLTYRVVDAKGNITNKTRTLKVIEALKVVDDTPPVIFGADVKASVMKGSPWNPLTGIYAYDTIDGLISNVTYTTDYDLSTVGTYTITYTAKDASNNMVEVIRTLEVFEPEPLVDTELPMIFASPVTIIQNRLFNPLDNVYAYDLVDGDLTSKITFTGNFNPNAVGTYTINYSVLDNAKNVTTLARTLTVIPPGNFEIVNSHFDLPFPTSISATGVSDTRAANNLATSYREDKSGFNWGFHYNGTGFFTASAENGIATIDIKNLGTNEFGIQFYQMNRKILKDTTYIIQFKAKADTPRSLRMVLEGGPSGRRFDVLYNLTTEWEVYTYVHNSVDEFTNGKFAFFMGQTSPGDVPTKIHFDYVTVSPVLGFNNTQGPDVLGAFDVRVLKDTNFDPLLGVTFRDRGKNVTIPNIVGGVTNPDIRVTSNVNTAEVGVYTVNYEVLDSLGNITNYTRTVNVEELAEGKFTNTIKLYNNDFSTPRGFSADTRPAGGGSALNDDWTWHGSIATGYTIGIENGEAVIDITNPAGHAVWSPHIYFLNRNFELGTVYEVTWRARADIARPMALRIEGAIGTLRHEETVNLTTTMETYTSRFILNNTNAPLSNGKFAFTFGNNSSVATKIYLDDVSVKVISEPLVTGETYLISYGDVTIPVDGMFNPTTGFVAYNAFDSSVNNTNVVITGDQVDNINGQYFFDSSVAGVYTVTYSIKDRWGVTVTLQRKITVQ